VNRTPEAGDRSSFWGVFHGEVVTGKLVAGLHDVPCNPADLMVTTAVFALCPGYVNERVSINAD
jgi:hypothetical protein